MILLDLLLPVVDALPHAAPASYDTDDDGGILLLLAMGPAGAALVYWGLYRYYRNTDKSHDYERDTAIAAQPVTGNDRKVSNRNGTTASSVDNANHNSHRARVNRLR